MHSHGRATQRVLALHQGRLESLDLPHPQTRLGFEDLLWGDAHEPLTAAYWAAQTWMWQLHAPHHYRLGRTLTEELLACLLGGYGIPAEVGLAAYDRLRSHVAAGGSLDEARNVEELLSAPLSVNGRSVRYRFARQKAAYVAAAFQELPRIDDTIDDVSLRNCLMTIRGVGPKTASWVVRNVRGSDRVAILDVHILRAGHLLGIFADHFSVDRHYEQLEAAYLKFADRIDTRASILDSVMWMTMRQLPVVSRPAAVPASHRQKIVRQPELVF